jgi:hypothetical protein
MYGGLWPSNILYALARMGTLPQCTKLAGYVIMGTVSSQANMPMTMHAGSIKSPYQPSIRAPSC